MNLNSPKLASIENCTGCLSCYNICPTSAIYIVKNKEGFIQPKINSTKCISCFKCSSSCPEMNDKEQNKIPIKSYAGCGKNKIIENSASGGIFATLAKNIISNGGTVYGVTLKIINNIPEVYHTRISNIDNIKDIQGSKYVQSFIGKIYIEVKKDLDNGKTVLFSGTPCQIAGLKSFLNKEYKNLYTVDLICHGVPSIEMFSKYLIYLSKKYGESLSSFIFRSKCNGWGPLIATVTTESGIKKIINYRNSVYLSLFLKGYIYRDSCYNCKYANLVRIGDITIGDYWGVEKEEPTILKNKLSKEEGISCILINSRKGIKLLQDFGKDIIIAESKLIKIATNNSQLIKPVNNYIHKKKRIIGLNKVLGIRLFNILYKFHLPL